MRVDEQSDEETKEVGNTRTVDDFIAQTRPHHNGSNDQEAPAATRRPLQQEGWVHKLGGQKKPAFVSYSHQVFGS